MSSVIKRDVYGLIDKELDAANKKISTFRREP